MRMLIFLLLIFMPLLAQAELQVDALKVTTGPLVDGDRADVVWAQAKPVLINDETSNETILLSAAYTDERIYFLVQYPDKAENPLHKPWMWDDKKGQYVQGPHREDTFVFKWNMMDHDVHLSNFSDDDYRADVWYWKANRTNLSGYADDKMHVLGGKKQNKKSLKMRSFSGKERYLNRISDAGSAPYREDKPTQKTTPVVSRYLPAQPSGSRGDIQAKGRWVSGFWVVEFSRKLQTGHTDDVQFSSAKSALFGVSIFSLYGNRFDVTSPNLYGRGRVSEPLRLNFLK